MTGLEMGIGVDAILPLGELGILQLKELKK
jgi:hypothetical protein